jgi:hypothetical protein
MMITYLFAMAIILLMLLGWVLVQHLARLYASRHPEFGPAREEGGGCGQHCGCSAGHCERETMSLSRDDKKMDTQHGL